MSPLQEIRIGITRSLWRRCKNRLVRASSYYDMLTYQVRLQDPKSSPSAMLLLYDMYSTKSAKRTTCVYDISVVASRTFVIFRLGRNAWVAITNHPARSYKTRALSQAVESRVFTRIVERVQNYRNLAKRIRQQVGCLEDIIHMSDRKVGTG
jgi:hypothetical protein